MMERCPRSHTPNPQLHLGNGIQVSPPLFLGKGSMSRHHSGLENIFGNNIFAVYSDLHVISRLQLCISHLPMHFSNGIMGNCIVCVWCRNVDFKTSTQGISRALSVWRGFIRSMPVISKVWICANLVVHIHYILKKVVEVLLGMC